MFDGFRRKFAAINQKRENSFTLSHTNFNVNVLGFTNDESCKLSLYHFQFKLIGCS